MTDTISGLIRAHPDNAPAIGAPGRRWLTYGALRDMSAQIAGQLHAAGVGRGHRVAIVLPNGPEMAAAFVTIAQCCVTAPLNPAYRRDEYAYYLEDLGARALVVPQNEPGGDREPAVMAARKLGLQILRLSVPEAAPAGAFAITPDGDAPPGCDRSAPDPDDVALILHTSGTTSQPKIVPLLHSNVCASARNVGASLALTAQDRCLNIMPLFHIHGLIAAVAASLAAGGSIWCAPGFDALRFFRWMQEANPSWYTAVPTMHQALLSRARRNAGVIANSRLRFLRSSSASLPAQVMRELTATFAVPVIESYGMTESAHQMTSNPLAEGAQIPGSVGVAAGPMVRIAHETKNQLIEGTGEVVISGPNVTPGYESNPAANATNFFVSQGRRWFRTGDQGALDARGYLNLTGRLKEIINRGGEKISPLEIDGVLMDHPAIAQVVTFGLAHPGLGEEVAAAVVLRQGETADEAGIRAFVAERVAGFKVPRRVIILDEIPKGATGKLQRIGMAEKLGLVEPE